MTTFTDLLASIKDEMMARYKSPFWGVAFFALIFVHWEVVLYFILDKHNSCEAIAFVKENVTFASVGGAFAIALCYIILFPWIELFLTKLASNGIRARNDFQIRERERELGRRKIISSDEAKVIEAELRNKEDQSKLADIELARHYQGLLSGENFSRWLKDVEKDSINMNLSHAIFNYLNKADSVEGRFINSAIENVHEQFIDAISTLNSTFQDSRSSEDAGKKNDLKKFAIPAYEAYKNYRRVVREELGI